MIQVKTLRTGRPVRWAIILIIMTLIVIIVIMTIVIFKMVALEENATCIALVIDKAVIQSVINFWQLWNK